MDTDGSRARRLATVAIGVVAVLWGATFTLTAHAVAALPPTQVVSWRFGLAAVLVVLCTRRARPLPGPLRRRGTVLGSLLGLGFLLQTQGLETTDAMTSGLLTGLLVVVAPVVETVVLGRRHRGTVWLAVGLAALGLVVLCARPSGLGRGELLTVGAAAVWAVHLVLTSRWSVPEHAAALARRQTVVVAVLALGVALLGAPRQHRGQVAVPVGTWVLVVLLAVVCTALPMVLLTWGQSRVDATRTAVVLTAEPAVAAAVAVLAGAPLGPRVVLGGLLVVTAMVLVQREGTGAVAGARTDTGPARAGGWRRRGRPSGRILSNPTSCAPPTARGIP